MNWFPAISSTTILAILGVILSVPYRKAVELAIGAKFDGKLEETKAEFRRQEEILRAQLRTRDAEIDALRSGALSSLAARHAELGKRRIIAVERVWSYVTSQARLKMLSKFAEVTRMDVMVEEAERGGSGAQKIREFAVTLLKSANADDTNTFEKAPDQERPFIPELTWALFIAYRQLLAGLLIHLHMVKAGITKDLLADPSGMAKILKEALPHQAAFVDERGASGFPFLLEELEQTLLQSLRESLDQREADKSAVDQALSIMTVVEEVVQSRAKMPDASFKT